MRLFNLGIRAFFIVFDHLFNLGSASSGLAVACANAYRAPQGCERKASAPDGLHNRARRNPPANADLFYILN